MNSPVLPLHTSSLSTEKPRLNLLSLGIDIHHRILDYLLPPLDRREDSGLCVANESALSLAMTCRTMQAVVASRFKSDKPFWCEPNAKTRWPFTIRSSLFHWYRVCSSSLTSIIFTENFIPDYNAFIHILHILISGSPPTRSLDIVILSADDVPKGVFSNLVLFLQCIRTTLTNLEIEHSPKLFKHLKQSKLPRLESVSVAFIRKDTRCVRDLIYHFARESEHFSHLSIRMCYDNEERIKSQLPHQIVKLMDDLALHSLSRQLRDSPKSDHFLNFSTHAKGLAAHIVLGGFTSAKSADIKAKLDISSFHVV